MDKTPRMNRKPGIQDTFQTPPHALAPLLQYLLPFKYVWEPCAGGGLIVEVLTHYGFTVWMSDIAYSEDQDFFTYIPPEPWPEVIVTNPPFSEKYKMLERCFQLQVPFALLVPSNTVDALSFKILFDQYNNNPYEIEVLKPDRRINFKTPLRGWDGSSAQMHTSWITQGLNVSRSRTDYLKSFYVPMRGNVRYSEDDQEIIV